MTKEKDQKDENPFVKPLRHETHAGYVFGACADCCMCCDGFYLTAPVLLNEMFETAKLFPVVFVENKGEYELRLLYTLKKDVPCPYLDREAGWCRVYDSVRPRACQSYPFNVVPAARGPKGLSYAVVYDERCPGVRDSGEGIPLFDDNKGFSAELTARFIGPDVLANHPDYVKQTRDFLQLVKELELLVEEKIRIGTRQQPVWKSGNQDVFYTVLKIDEEKLKALATPDVVRIHQLGFFNHIYTHLNSLANFSRLFSMLLAHEPAPVDLIDFRFG